MVDITRTLAAVGTLVIVGVLISAALISLSPKVDSSVYGCVGMDGSTYKVSEKELQGVKPLFKGAGTVQGVVHNVYVPKMNLQGCIEVKDE